MTAVKVLRAGFASVLLACVVSTGAAFNGAPAQAIVIPPPVAPAIIGSVPTAAAGAVSAGAACVASVVCATAVAAVGLTAIGVGLYASRDTWVPTVKGWFNPGETQQAPGPTANQSVDNWITLHSAGLVEPNIFELHVTHGAVAYIGQGHAAWNLRADYVCKVADGLYSWGGFWWGGNVDYGVTTHARISCPTDTEFMGVITRRGVPGEYPSNPAPSNVIAWGSVDYPDAGNLYRATVQCVKADGSTQPVVVEYMGQAPGVGNGFMVPSCKAAGVGDHAKSVDVDVKPDGAVDFRHAWDVAPTADPLYPDCDPTMATGCVLSVWVDGTICQVGDARCLDWSSHSSSRLACHWGPYEVPLVRCDMLERAYRPGGAALTEPNIDGNPGTYTDAPAATPSPTPTSTAQVPAPVPSPVPIPSTVPTPGPSDAPPVPDPDDPTVGESGCWPSGSVAWNPLEWVLRPVQCALVWAFKPTPGTVEALYAQVQVRAPFSVAVEGFDGAQQMVSAYSGSGSCGSIADFTTDDIDGLIECDAFSRIPGATALRALVGVVLVTLTALSVLNMATARFSGGGETT